VDSHILPNSTLRESLKWTFMIYYYFYMSPSSSDLVVVVVAEENKTSVLEGDRGWCRCHFWVQFVLLLILSCCLALQFVLLLIVVR
jgi:hypothetical protein